MTVKKRRSEIRRRSGELAQTVPSPTEDGFSSLMTEKDMFHAEMGFFIGADKKSESSNSTIKKRLAALFDYLLSLRQPSRSSLGGKNSSVGNCILRNSSQGLSVCGPHSLVGMQKSNTGTSICTLRMS